jgi:pimeloyl-ACP methyl ester carboxylesterase
MLGRPDSLADLAAVRVPTLVLCGAGDAATPPADHEAIAARVTGARLVVVPESGHLTTIEQPAAVNAALSAWLADPSAPAGAAR